MWVKICANTSLHDAQLAAELGADAVGFVFAPSKRQVAPAQVAEITPHLPGSVETIGVFAAHGSDDAAEVIEAVEVAGLTGVQLHGECSLELAARLNDAFEGRVRLIQTTAFEVAPSLVEEAEQRFRARVRRAVDAAGVDAILIDAMKSGASGGLGVAFDWMRAAELVQSVFAEARAAELPNVIVAGGLRPENVGDAIRAFQPYGVDVASGVEASPGVKDVEKLKAFLAAARRTAGQQKQ